MLSLPHAAQAQRPAAAFLDLPAQVPDFGVFLRYGRGSLPFVRTVSSFGADVEKGFGARRGSPYKRDLVRAGGALFTGGTVDGTGWGVDGALGHQLRPPFPGNFGLGVSTRLAGAYTHLPTAPGRLNQADASLALGVGAYAPTPTVGNFELWLMPRLQLRHTDVILAGAARRGTSLGPGAAAGFGYFSRSSPAVGVNVGFDVVGLKDPGSDQHRARRAFAVELQLLR